ncbi:glycosyltransferase family 2 protein [Lacticaseibacillus daqingensis]|uniref:glycosyltransferase family 2 protein n=1 Tax=Lacticaseibacillus daqingensis TaxID=2486014 RepID=UPI000F788266|nr:glycosyltransferase family 2 protein [Lacticaseibacillus daqingensis]
MLSIIIPCFNEQETIYLFYDKVKLISKQIAMEIEFVFVNDGSTDATLEKLRELSLKDSAVHYLSFSRNFGKEAALYAGLKSARGDFVTVMDADLQDPPELLPEMLSKLLSGDMDCIGTRRGNRAGEPRVRSFFARQFYRVINRISDTEMIDGARDFRLMTRQMVDAVLSLAEYNRFSKGLFSWVGFKTEYITYENRERVAGTTSWSFWQLFNYSIDGIVNFSDVPLNIASFVGALSCFGALISLIFVVVRAVFWGDPTTGWPSLVSVILLLGGIQLLSLGIIGKYIGKIFLETKHRPIFLVKETDQNSRKDTNS